MHGPLGRVIRVKQEDLDAFVEGARVAPGISPPPLPGGRLVERVDATGTTTYIYDALNRVVEERLPGGRVNAYTYAASAADTALRQSVTDKANKTTSYSYDDLDRLTQAKSTSSSGAVVDDFRYGYDAVGNRISETVRQNTLLGAQDRDHHPS